MSDEADPPPSILAKAFTLLGVFGQNDRVLSLSEIGRASGLPKSTVHRLLARLVELGAIEQHRSGYRIGIALFQLGVSSPAIGMRDLATPILAMLHHRSQFTVHLAVLRQFDVVILERIARRNLPSATSGPGVRLPANCTALGKVLLAHENLDDLDMFLPQPMPSMTPGSVVDVGKLLAELHEIREVGLARETDEAHGGLACLAAPVMVLGSPVAAVSAAFPAAAPLIPDIEATLRQAAARIAREVQIGLGEGRVHWFPREIDRPTQRRLSARWLAQ